MNVFHDKSQIRHLRIGQNLEYMRLSVFKIQLVSSVVHQLKTGTKAHLTPVGEHEHKH